MNPTIFCIKKYLEKKQYYEYGFKFEKKFGFSCMWYTYLNHDELYKTDKLRSIADKFTEPEKEKFKFFFINEYPELRCENCIHKYAHKLTEKCNETYVKE